MKDDINGINHIMFSAQATTTFKIGTGHKLRDDLNRIKASTVTIEGLKRKTKQLAPKAHQHNSTFTYSNYTLQMNGQGFIEEFWNK